MKYACRLNINMNMNVNIGFKYRCKYGHKNNYGCEYKRQYLTKIKLK